MREISRKWVVAGNWKMNLTQKELSPFFETLKTSLESIPSAKTALETLIFAPYTLLSSCQAIKSETLSSIAIGAQNAHWETEGAFTGEVSGPQLKDLGIEHVLIGHSERRQWFGETNQTTARRVQSLLRQGLNVMACVGETLEDREKKQTEGVIQNQLDALFKSDQAGSFDKTIFSSLTIAYEPVWAIGTGKTATPEQAQSVHALIRQRLGHHLGDSKSQAVSIVYGGSVKPESFPELLDQPDIDGGLIGGASLKPEIFATLIQQANERASR